MDDYIERHIEGVVQRALKTFGAALVTGARQTGKTTLLVEGVKGYRYVTLDDPVKLRTAGLFLSRPGWQGNRSSVMAKRNIVSPGNKETRESHKTGYCGLPGS